MAWFRTEKQFLAAAAAGDIDTLRDYLDKKPGWIGTRDKKGNSALHHAVMNGQYETVKFLIAKGAQVGEYNKIYAYPLHLALERGDVEMVRLLFEKGSAGPAFVNGGAYAKSGLQLAIDTDNPDLVKMILATGNANLIDGETPAVSYATMHRKGAALKTLLEAGADPNVPLHRVEKELMSSFFSDFYREKDVYVSPLDLATQANDTAMSLALLAAGAKPRKEEYPLHYAAHNGNIELATALLEHGVSINARNRKFQTPLHMAAMKNQLEMARFLLAQGLSKDMKDVDERTAASYAQQYAMKEMTELLQGPLPAITPVKPVVKEQPAPVVVAAPVVAAPKPQIATNNNDSETWTLAGKNSLAHVSTYPALGRKLTELFNFESRERVVITENMNLKTESMGPHENFDNVSEDALTRALKEFRRLGGKTTDDHVFRNRLTKLPGKP